jgi:aspartate oxidase
MQDTIVAGAYLCDEETVRVRVQHPSWWQCLLSCVSLYDECISQWILTCY